MSGLLIICATPIGNLGDASPRLTDALSGADVVYAEDTRRTATLLGALKIDRPLRSYFVGNEEERAAEVEDRLGRGETVALVTDAGTPSVADPGVSAVRAAVSAGSDITVIPGPSAVTAALAVSGLGADRFVFEGFLPRRGAARKDRLSALADEERTMVLFASPTRLVDDVADLVSSLGPGRRVVVARELTKLHEEVWRGTLEEAGRRWSEIRPCGEFTLVVAGGTPEGPSLEGAVEDVRSLMAAGASHSAAVRHVAGTSGIGRRRLYEATIGDEA